MVAPYLQNNPNVKKKGEGKLSPFKEALAAKVEAGKKATQDTVSNSKAKVSKQDVSETAKAISEGFKDVSFNVSEALGRRIGYALILVASLLYLFAEIPYFTELVNTVSDANQDFTDLEKLGDWGKMLASIGLVLALFGSSMLKLPGMWKLATVALFPLMVFSTYKIIDYSYKSEIVRLDTDVAIDAAISAEARLRMMNHELKKEDFPEMILPGEHGYAGSFAMINFSYVLSDRENFFKPIKQKLSAAQNKVTDRINNIDADWEKYKELDKNISTLKNEYLKHSKTFRARVKGKPEGPFYEAAKLQFMKKSGGLEPFVSKGFDNDGRRHTLSHEDFVRDYLPKSNLDVAIALRNTLNSPIIKMRDGFLILAKDIPLEMQKPTFTRWAKAQMYQQQKELQLPDEDFVIDNPQTANQAKAAIFVPPVSMTLSVMGIVLNVAKCLTLLVFIALPMLAWWKSALISIGITSTTVAGTFMMTPSSAFLGTAFHTLEMKMLETMTAIGPVQQFIAEIWIKVTAIALTIFSII